MAKLTELELSQNMSLERLGLPLGSEMFLPASYELFQAVEGRLGVEAGKRRKLHQVLAEYFVANKIGTETETPAGVLNDMADLIEADPNHIRLILYLPFELIPDNNDPRHEAERLRQAIRTGWFELLFQSNARASFIDGDIFEPGMAEPERIRKAGHLIPVLVEKGIITEKDVEEIKEKYPDEELVKSLNEGLAAIGLRIVSEKQTGESTDEVMNDFRQELSQIDEFFSDSDYAKSVSGKRVVWEKGVKESDLIDRTVKRLKTAEGSTDFVRQTLASDDINLRILGIRLMKEIRLIDEDLLIETWLSGNNKVRNEITFTISHWMRLGLIDDKLARLLGVTIPDFYRPVAINKDKFAGEDFRFLGEAAKQIKEDEELSKFLLPFFLVIGSRTKGYDALGADKDFVIFFKPGTDPLRREEIINKLLNKIPSLKDDGQILETWLSVDETGYNFRDMPLKTVIGRRQPQFWFDGIWIGQGAEMKEVYQDVVNRYLDLDRLGENKDAVRSYCLFELEHDLLQYRLMHKGFRQFYPSQKPEVTNGETIDWKSDFWEPEYRRIATLLYISRVFLPDLGKK